MSPKTARVLHPPRLGLENSLVFLQCGGLITCFAARRCFDVAARTIYRRPQPQPTPEAEAEAGAEVEPEEVEVEVEVAADNEASSSGGQCAAAAGRHGPERTIAYVCV